MDTDKGPQVGIYIVDRQGDYMHCMRHLIDAPSTPLYATEVKWDDACSTCGRPLVESDLDAMLAKTESELLEYIVGKTDLNSLLWKILQRISDDGTDT